MCSALRAETAPGSPQSSACSARCPARAAATWPGEIRRARGQISLTQQFRTQAILSGRWTVFGLAQALGVHRNWLHARIRTGLIPAVRHPVLGQYPIPDDPGLLRTDPGLLQTLRAQRERCGYR